MEPSNIIIPGVYRVDGAVTHSASFSFVDSPPEDASRPMTDAEFALYTERRARGGSLIWTNAVE